MSPSELELLGAVEGEIDVGAHAWATREGENGTELVVRADRPVVIRPRELTRIARLWLDLLLDAEECGAQPLPLDVADLARG